MGDIMDDIRPAVRDDTRSMTYADIAAARGISADSTERLVRRRRWPKQLGNDGTVRVLVPADEAQPASVRSPGRRQAGHPGATSPGDSPGAVLPAIREVIREVIQPLTEQLAAANRRADAERERANRAEQRIDEERARAEQAEQRAATLQAELAEVRIAERGAVELAECAGSEVADLRGRLDAADQRADRERDRADQAEQQLTKIEAELVQARVESSALRCQLDKASRQPPLPEPPRTRWRRLLRVLGHTR